MLMNTLNSVAVIIVCLIYDGKMLYFNCCVCLLLAIECCYLAVFLPILPSICEGFICAARWSHRAALRRPLPSSSVRQSPAIGPFPLSPPGVTRFVVGLVSGKAPRIEAPAKTFPGRRSVCQRAARAEQRAAATGKNMRKRHTPLHQQSAHIDGYEFTEACALRLL
jgi:hypothetical protein